jgi:integrase
MFKNEASAEALLAAVRAMADADQPIAGARAAFEKALAAAYPARNDKTISTQVQAASVGPGEWPVAGSPGLLLVVRLTGARAWVRRFKIAGKRREMGLGSLADVSLADARRAADEIKALLTKGVDPINARLRDRQAALAESRKPLAGTFQQAAENYYTLNQNRWKSTGYSRYWMWPLVKHAYPVIGDLDMNDVTVEHVVEVVRRREAAAQGTKVGARTGGVAAARSLREKIEAIFDAALATGRRDRAKGNPAERKAVNSLYKLARGEVEHIPAVPIDDAPAIFRTLLSIARSSPEKSVALSAWCFAILTATRANEAIKAKWSEIEHARDPGRALWTIPGGKRGRMKMGRVMKIPLSTAALEILDLMAARREGDAVFPGRTPGSSMTYSNVHGAAKRAGIDAACMHGWRSTFKGWATRNKVVNAYSEDALSHRLSPVDRAYCRLDEIGAEELRRPVMQAFADWLMSGDAKVLPFVRSA